MAKLFGYDGLDWTLFLLFSSFSLLFFLFLFTCHLYEILLYYFLPGFETQIVYIYHFWTFLTIDLLTSFTSLWIPNSYF
jgi:hypothetical protein